MGKIRNARIGDKSNLYPILIGYVYIFIRVPLGWDGVRKSCARLGLGSAIFVVNSYLNYFIAVHKSHLMVRVRRLFIECTFTRSVFKYFFCEKINHSMNNACGTRHSICGPLLYLNRNFVPPSIHRIFYIIILAYFLYTRLCINLLI
jgi:hypothetical protein